MNHHYVSFPYLTFLTTSTTCNFDPVSTRQPAGSQDLCHARLRRFTISFWKRPTSSFGFSLRASQAQPSNSPSCTTDIYRLPIRLCELVCSHRTSKAVKSLRLINHSLWRSDNGSPDNFPRHRTLLKDPYDEWTDFVTVLRLLKAAILPAFD